jgi:hypothetical protein
MNDRDTFAAAALTGLLVSANNDIDEDTLDTPSDIAYTAYQLADAMLAERARLHFDDAGYTAGISPDAETKCCGTTANGSPAATAEPFAWVAWFDDEETPDADFLFSTKERADDWCCKRGADAVPLYRQPKPSRGSVVEAERPLGDPEIAIELLTLRVKELEGRKVLLPGLDPNGAPGWNAAIGAVREALADAGVEWDTE